MCTVPEHHYVKTEAKTYNMYETKDTTIKAVVGLHIPTFPTQGRAFRWPLKVHTSGVWALALVYGSGIWELRLFLSGCRAQG